MSLYGPLTTGAICSASLKWVWTGLSQTAPTSSSQFLVGIKVSPLLLAFDFLQRYLDSIYTEEESAMIISEVLQAMLAHHLQQQVLTLEAGIVRIADALDMEQGRARIPFEAGKVDIHSISALSIEKVEILEGSEKPIVIRIKMSNSVGIFQIDELLKARIQNSRLEKYIHVIAEIVGEKERKIIDKFEL